MSSTEHTATAEGRTFRPAALAEDASMTASLASLAALMDLDPVEAIALPTAVTVVSRKVGMTDTAMVAEMGRNAALRDYLAGICRETDVIGALS